MSAMDRADAMSTRYGFTRGRQYPATPFFVRRALTGPNGPRAIATYGRIAWNSSRFFWPAQPTVHGAKNRPGACSCCLRRFTPCPARSARFSAHCPARFVRGGTRNGNGRKGVQETGSAGSRTRNRRAGKAGRSRGRRGGRTRNTANLNHDTQHHDHHNVGQQWLGRTRNTGEAYKIYSRTSGQAYMQHRERRTSNTGLAVQEAFGGGGFALPLVSLGVRALHTHCTFGAFSPGRCAALSPCCARLLTYSPPRIQENAPKPGPARR